MGFRKPRNAAYVRDAAAQRGPVSSVAVAGAGPEAAGAAAEPAAAEAGAAAADEGPRRRGDRGRVRRPRPSPRGRGGVRRAPAERAAGGKLVAPRGRRRGRRGRGWARRGERDHRALRAQPDVEPRRRRPLGHLRRLRVPRRRRGNASQRWQCSCG